MRRNIMPLQSMRCPATLLGGLALAACSSAPVAFSGVAPPGRAAAYQCAVAQLNILGYTIEDGNSDAGFVRGRKQTSGLGLQIVTGNTYHDVLVATVFDNPATGDTNLRVVATRLADHDVGLVAGISDEPAQGQDRIAPSETGLADARAVLQGCGVSQISDASQPAAPGGKQVTVALEGVMDGA